MTREEAVRRIERTAEEKLMELDLSGLELQEVPPEIAKCTQLETLLLARSYEKKKNKLTKFPDAVLQLTNLKILKLNHNKITSIRETIGQLSNLTQLTLFATQITQLPETIGQLSNLAELDLQSNQISQLPEAFGKLSNLTELNRAYKSHYLHPRSDRTTVESEKA
jgi:internalin A